jgi:hypothetical protein
MRVDSNLAIKQSYVAVFSSNSYETQLQKKDASFLVRSSVTGTRDVILNGDVYFKIYVGKVYSSNF